MVDTFRPLELGEGGAAAEDRQYAWTWSAGDASDVTVPAVAHGLFDDAALFPPGNAPMAGRGAGARGADRGLVRRTGRAGSSARPAGWPSSTPSWAGPAAGCRSAVTVPAGPDGLPDAVRTARDACRRIDLVAAELPMPVGSLDQAVDGCVR